ncbi:MAG: hypothetical protein ACR2NA_04995 [Solirubrobacterales bacterium]
MVADAEKEARVEPRDKRGESLAVTASGQAMAEIAVEQVKAGFLRKSRVYKLEMIGAPPADHAPLVLGAAIRYDAALTAVGLVSMRD